MLQVFVDGKPQERIGPFVELDVTLRSEVLDGGYLGEPAPALPADLGTVSFEMKLDPRRSVHWPKSLRTDVAPGVLVRRLHRRATERPDIFGHRTTLPLRAWARALAEWMDGPIGDAARAWCAGKGIAVG